MRSGWLFGVLWLVAGCGSSTPAGGSQDGGMTDGVVLFDAGVDVQVADAASMDAGGVDVAAVDTGPSCGAGQTLCGGACVATGTDPANCGTCGHACASVEYCAGGSCVTASTTQRSCPDPTERGCGVVAIPVGSFVMGGDTGAVNDTPAAGTMTIGAYSLDAYEVTVSRFRRFWTAGHPAATSPLSYPGGTVTWTGGGVTEPDTLTYCTWSETPGSLEAHPINCVDWYTAQAFCVWDGGRLPTEAEWEYAARGTSLGGLTPERSYPWGNTDPSPACDLAEWNACPGDDGTGTKRVGSFAPSAGLYDLAGNVREWSADWFANYTDTTCWNGVARSNPVCNNGASGGRVVRGGSWGDGDVASLRSASRVSSPPPYRLGYVGCRCARSP